MVTNLVVLLNMAIICLLLALPASVIAETKVRTNNKYINNKIAVQHQFDSKITTFQSGDANNEMTIFNAYLKQTEKFSKNEYESKSEYTKRIENICNDVLVNNIKFCDTIGLLITKNIIYTYDAEKRQLAVMVPIEKLYDHSLNSYPRAIEISSELFDKKTYTAANAYNAKALVTSTIYDKFSVASNRFGYQNDRLVYKVMMSSFDAMEMKKWGGLVIVGGLKYPFIGSDTRKIEPTITEPVENLDRIHYITLDTYEVWVVNRKSGKIHHKEICRSFGTCQSE